MTRPEFGVPVLSTEDFARIVDTYADRVHDLVRRLGVSSDAAAEIVLTSAADLIDAAAAGEPATADPVGWWFARALALARRVELASPDDLATANARDTEDDTEIRAALDNLPDVQRLAVMLRDDYDLPPVSVANVLAYDPASAAQATALGRLDLLVGYDGRPSPTLAGHTGRPSVAEGELGLLADGGLDVDMAGVLRRHVTRCPACEDVLAAQDRARRLAAGLPIDGLRDDDREVVLPQLKARAAAVLPTLSEVLVDLGSDVEDRPLVSPLLVVAVVSLALVLGILFGAGVLTDDDSSDAAAAPSPTATPSSDLFPSASPTETVTATPTATRSRSPRPSRTPTPTPSPTPSPTFSPTPSPAPVPGPVRLQPEQGASGTQVRVFGRGWAPGTTLEIDFLNRAGNSVSHTSTSVRPGGGFVALVTADDTRGLVDNGQRTVEVTDGSLTRTAIFVITS